MLSKYLATCCISIFRFVSNFTNTITTVVSRYSANESSKRFWKRPKYFREPRGIEGNKFSKMIKWNTTADI